MSKKKEFTEFQKFVLDLVNSHGKELNANYVATMWMEKRGKYAAASRDRFGYTSNSYKTLRKLFHSGLIKQRTYKSAGGYTFELYQKLPAHA